MTMTTRQSVSYWGMIILRISSGSSWSNGQHKHRGSLRCRAVRWWMRSDDIAGFSEDDLALSHWLLISSVMMTSESRGKMSEEI